MKQQHANFGHLKAAENLQKRLLENPKATKVKLERLAAGNYRVEWYEKK